MARPNLPNLRLLLANRNLAIGGLIIAVHILVAIVAGLLTSYDPVANDAGVALQGPSGAHWLGTDLYGRDVLARTMFGGRYALQVTFIATAIAVSIGSVLGVLVAYLDNWVDDLVMRIMDAILSVPSLLALLVVVSVFGAGMWVIILAVTIVYVPAITRVVRGAGRGVATLDYVTAARARGEGAMSIVRREILPNVLDTVLVEFAMRASWVVLLISSLSFLGFGANPPTPDWGLMVSENRTALTVVPWATLAPILALATFVIGMNLAADGLSKAFGIDRQRAGVA